MEEKKIDRLYKLLERTEKERDADSVVAEMGNLLPLGRRQDDTYRLPIWLGGQSDV